MQEELVMLQIHFCPALQFANTNVAYVPRQCVIHYILHNLPGEQENLGICGSLHQLFTSF